MNEGKIILRSEDGRSIVISDKDIVGRTTVGKDVLDSCEGVSRQHVQFFRGDTNWFLVDLGSKNGTLLNGAPVTPRKMTPLSPGDSISLSKSFSAVMQPERRNNESVPDESEDPGDKREIMVVMFVDLKGSTDYFQEKGTMIASTWINNFYAILSKVITTCDGRHIKNIGDAILAVFKDPLKAARAAVMMQRETKIFNASAKDDDHYYIRIGLNMGKVLCENNDVFGNTVNIASRIQYVTPPEKTFISESLYTAIKSYDEFHASFVRHEELRGVKNSMAVYELHLEAPVDKRTTTQRF